MRALFLVGMVLTGCSASAITRADAGAVTKSGTITIEQGPTYTEIFATFRTRTLLKQEPGCTVVVSGNCTATDCRSAVPARISETYQSAGTLDVTGPSLDVHLDPAELSLQYRTTLTGLAQWLGAEPLNATVTGSEVPAFSSEAITAPSFVSLTAPSCPLSDCGSIPHDVPLLVSWSGGKSGTVNIRLNGSSDGEPGKSVTCIFAASAGTGTVPVEMLSTLRDSSPRYGSLSVSTHSSRVFNAGDYAVTFHAGTQGMSGKVTFSP